MLSLWLEAGQPGSLSITNERQNRLPINYVN
jgi:hypothetical protein